jgi:nitroreductase
MELQEVLRRRRMVRAYRDDDVPPDLVTRVLDAGCRAPTAGDTQATEFLVLQSDEMAPFWADVAPHTKPGGRWSGLQTAKVVIVVLLNAGAYTARYAQPDKGDAHTNPDWPVTDAAFAVMSMLLAATDAGLGACFFNVDVDRPDVFGAISLGWPADVPPAQARARRDARVHHGSWAT